MLSLLSHAVDAAGDLFVASILIGSGRKAGSNGLPFFMGLAVPQVDFLEPVRLLGASGQPDGTPI